MLLCASCSCLSEPGLGSRQRFDGEQARGCPGLPTQPHNARSVLGRRAALGPMNLSFVAQPPAAAPASSCRLRSCCRPAPCGSAASTRSIPPQHNGLLIPFLPPPLGLLALHIPTTQRKYHQRENSASSQRLAGPRQPDGHLGLMHGAVTPAPKPLTNHLLFLYSL